MTSYLCQWKAPRKRKESNQKFADISFEKHTYGRKKKHQWKPIKGFDPRPNEHRGTAPARMDKFLEAVKGQGLGVSLLFDNDVRCSDPQPLTSEYQSTHSRQELVEKVATFKESLRVSSDKVREIERNTREQHLSPLWYSARRFRLTASTFGRILHFQHSTPPDSLVRSLLQQKNFSTTALEWGKRHESTALSEYTKHHHSLGNCNIVVCKAGFVICEEHPFLGASPDGYVYDSHSETAYGLVEIKCPYKYRNFSPNDAAKESDFCCKLATSHDGRSVLELNRSHAKCKASLPLQIENGAIL